MATLPSSFPFSWKDKLTVLPCFVPLPQNFTSPYCYFIWIPSPWDLRNSYLQKLQWDSTAEAVYSHEFKKFWLFKLIESMYISIHSFICSPILLSSPSFKSCLPKPQLTDHFPSLTLFFFFSFLIYWVRFWYFFISIQ